MGLLAPMLLAGLAFLGIPWWIHRRRRPPRNPTPFSSLMFVPEATTPRRARKEIEHPWLMAFRMILLALLALTFARPFQRVLATPEEAPVGVAYHVVLVDVSTSMGAPDLQASREEAIASALDKIASADQVAVVAFDQRPHVLQPLGDGGGRAEARAALGALPVSAGHTDFRRALNGATTMLLGVGADDGDGVRRTIHVISDLQRSALPAEGPALHLPESIALEIYPVVGLTGENVAVEEVVVLSDRSARLLVRARIRNHGEAPARVHVVTEVDGVAQPEATLTLAGLGSQAISMPVDADPAQPHQVHVRIQEPDGLLADNDGYAVHTPAALRSIGVYEGGGSPVSGEVNRFLGSAVADSQPLPWHLVVAEEGALADEAIRPWEVLIVLGGAIGPSEGAMIRDYVQGGGTALLIPSTAGFSPPVVDAFLVPASIALGASRYEEVSEGEYATFAWIDFSHPVFQHFSAPRYSDFSMVRFNNFFPVTVADDTQASVLARFDGGDGGGEYPAMLSFSAGAGQVVMWTFPLDSNWTNLTRTRRFVPMLHESIGLLLPSLHPERVWTAGGAASVPVDEDGALVFLPESTTPISLAEAGDPLERLEAPGIIQWQREDGTLDLAEAIRLDRRESDLGTYSPEEFRLRAGAFTAVTPAVDGATSTELGDIVHWEYGYALLALLLCGYLGEAGYAYWLGQQTPVESRRDG